MTSIPTYRPLALAALAALTLGTAACKPPEKTDAAATTTAAASPDGTLKIAGLKTEREQASYMIGMDMARSLEPVKDDVDVKALEKALETVLSGGKPLMTEEQAQQVREAFAKRVQASQMAKAETAAKDNLAAGQKFLADNAKKPGVKTTASGLQYKELRAGTGAKPAATDTVRVHYKGMLTDGKPFDSSYDRNEPVVFPLNQVVPGWQEGLQLMPVGSKYQLWIPAALGYGERGTPGGPIGPNSALVFEVELLDIVKGDAAAAQPAAPAAAGN